MFTECLAGSIWYFATPLATAPRAVRAGPGLTNMSPQPAIRAFGPSLTHATHISLLSTIQNVNQTTCVVVVCAVFLVTIAELAASRP